MPAHISFGDRLLQVRGYAALKAGKLGIGAGAGKDRGFSVADAGYYVRKLVEERQCVVPDYETYRLVIENWNPGRPAWTSNGEPPKPSLEHSRSARIGSHRGSKAIDSSFKGGHQAPKASFKTVNALNTTPVSPQEWSAYLASGCPTDRMIKAIFEKNEGVGLMFIRDGHAQRDAEKMKLKRLEMGKDRIWDILWSNHDR